MVVFSAPLGRQSDIANDKYNRKLSLEEVVTLAQDGENATSADNTDTTAIIKELFGDIVTPKQLQCISKSADMIRLVLITCACRR